MVLRCLNGLASNLIEGVDLNFDVESKDDYSTGSQQETTNLKVGASKNLFNDRLSVSVGSNVMLQGENQVQVFAFERHQSSPAFRRFHHEALVELTEVLQAQKLIGGGDSGNGAQPQFFP